MRRTIEVAGPAAVSDVWERYAVIAAWPSWSPPIRSVDASAPRIAAGVTGAVRGVGGLLLSFVVEEVDEAANRWSWRVAAGPLVVTLDHTVRAAEGGSGSVTGLTVDAIAPVALGYPEVARVALHRLVSEHLGS